MAIVSFEEAARVAYAVVRRVGSVKNRMGCKTKASMTAGTLLTIR
jgi:hypothetical protein